jgi:glycosyltransferase involved in cell wall biosynthesis
MKEKTPTVLMLTARADFGGGPEHLYRLINLLHHKINIYTACPEDYPYWNLYSKVLGSDHLIKIPHRKFRIGALLDLLHCLKKNKINIIHSHGKGAGIYSRFLSLLTGISCIHTFHGIHIGHYGRFKRNLYLLIEKILSRFTKQYISVSKSEKQSVIELNIAPEQRITLIQNGTPLHDKVSSVGKDNILRITSITRFDYAKNTSLMISIAEELLKLKDNKTYKFIVIGSGKGIESFKKEIEERNLDNIFEMTGSVTNPGDYLINSFCYISTSRWEGLPLGVLEAMSYGLPVIATSVPGNIDLVDHDKTGFLFNINKPEEAALYIKNLAGDEKNYAEFAGRSKEKIKKYFSLNNMAEETLNLYYKII